MQEVPHMDKAVRQYMVRIGRKGGRVVTAAKRANLARARAIKAAKKKASK